MASASRSRVPNQERRLRHDSAAGRDGMGKGWPRHPFTTRIVDGRRDRPHVPRKLAVQLIRGAPQLETVALVAATFAPGAIAV